MEPMPTPTYRGSRARRELTLAEALPALSRGDLRARHVRLLSDLSRSDMATLQAAWPTIPTETKAVLVRRMRVLAEEHIELDFSRVLRLALADADGRVRAAAIEGLWEDAGSDVAERFVDLLAHDPDVTVREAAARGLQSFARAAERGELPDELTETLRDTLVTVAGDQADAKDVRDAALEAVAAFERDAAIWHLIEDAYESADADDQAAAIRAMGHNQDPRWTRLVLDELLSRNQTRQLAAVEAIGELEEETAIPLLNGLVSSETPEIKVAAIRALGQIGGRGAVRVLRQHLQDADAAAEELHEAIDEASDALELYAPRPTDDE